MEVSNTDTKKRIEKVLSDILSDKYGYKITLKFAKENKDGNRNTTRDIDKK